MQISENLSKLEETFNSLDPYIKHALSGSSSPMYVTLAVLVLAQDHAGVMHLSAEQVSNLLEIAGVALTSTQITKALAKAGDKITRTRKNGQTYFRIMTKGRILVEPLLAAGPLYLVRIEAGKPRTARKKLEEILSPLSGILRVCDPYYGIRTLDSLALIPSSCSVRFLTYTTTEKKASLGGPFSDFKREHPNVEFRILQPPSTIHDRYILTEDTLLLLGHGIKDIGSKESFIVVVSSSFAGDLVQATQISFDHLWTRASPF